MQCIVWSSRETSFTLLCCPVENHASKAWMVTVSHGSACCKYPHSKNCIRNGRALLYLIHCSLPSLGLAQYSHAVLKYLPMVPELKIQWHTSEVSWAHVSCRCFSQKQKFILVCTRPVSYLQYQCIELPPVWCESFNMWKAKFASMG